MIQYERLQFITALAQENRFVTVEDIAQKLKVSAMTVRRDINMLCNQGKLDRCYGGACLPQVMTMEVQYDEKVNHNHAAKACIAQKAMEFIKDHQAIFLDGGTTTTEIAKLIAREKRKIQVVTCDLTIARILTEQNGSVIIVGGEVNSMTQSIFGHAANQFLKQFRFSKAFIGASSIDYNFDMFSPDANKAHMKNLLIDLAGKAYIVADSSKFYSSAMYFIASISQFSGIITDKTFNKSETKIIHDKGVNLIQA